MTEQELKQKRERIRDILFSLKYDTVSKLKQLNDLGVKIVDENAELPNVAVHSLAAVNMLKANFRKVYPLVGEK